MLTDSSARSWSSAASVSRATGRGPARFLRPILDARLGDGSRVAICVPPASPHVAITVHANNAESTLSRLASCAMQGGGLLRSQGVSRRLTSHVTPNTYHGRSTWHCLAIACARTRSDLVQKSLHRSHVTPDVKSSCRRSCVPVRDVVTLVHKLLDK